MGVKLENIQLVECPRDAMQGMTNFVDTQTKIDYINGLIQVGFHTIDCGSFVSPKAIPQMADTAAVLAGLTKSGKTKLLVIVANERGAEEACKEQKVDYLGFPFSISETFQQKNTNSNIATAYDRVKAIQNMCVASGKHLVVYLSMAFGNPYGDEYSADLLQKYATALAEAGVQTISLADTVGVAEAGDVFTATKTAIKSLPGMDIGVHLHSSSDNWKSKLDAALQAGCIRIDGAIKGFGGCPMAGNVLVGNMDTLNILSHLNEKGYNPNIDSAALDKAKILADHIFI